MRASEFPTVLVLVLFAEVSWASSDFEWTFNNNGNFDYTLTNVSSPQLFSGTLPADDPTINLVVGKRYGVNVVNPRVHPFEVIAKGAGPSSDVVLLSQGSIQAPFEADADVSWVDDGNGIVEFTLTLALAEAMSPSGKIPGYRCGIHVSTMRGDFTLLGGGTPIADPIPARIPTGSITIELETVLDGLAAPLGVTAPDDGTDRLFVHDQVGTVRVIENGVPLPTPFLDVRDRLVPLGISGPGSYDERGFLGFALHPDFASHPRVYTYTSEPIAGPADFTTPIPADRSHDHQSVIAEWAVDSLNPNLVDKATRREILRIDQPQFNHNAGALHFGPDGFLYIALGDGGGADDADGQQFSGGPIIGHGVNGNGQNIETILGTILRIDVDGANSANGKYGVPADNPFVGETGIDEIFAFGFRNPYSFSFDRETVELYAGDVGQNDVEEIDIVTRGGNYGWRLKEGTFFFDPNGADSGFVTTAPVAPVPGDVIDPIAEYDHDEGLSIIGGYVYRGSAIPELRGHYVTGDFGTFAAPAGRVFYLDAEEKLVEFRIGAESRPLGLWLKGFGQGRDGEIYVCGSEELGPFGSTGKVLKIIPDALSVDSWVLR